MTKYMNNNCISCELGCQKVHNCQFIYVVSIQKGKLVLETTDF